MPEFVGNNSGDSPGEILDLDYLSLNSITVETLSNNIWQYTFKRHSSRPQVAEFRSITAAAANLDMRTATASAGERYIPQCEQALLMLDQARQNMKVF